MAATHTHFVDGKKNLADQQDALDFMEQFSAAKVITYFASPHSPDPLKVNEAVLTPVPLGEQPPEIELVAVPAGGNVAAIITAQIAAGKTIVFHEKCWVESKETVVIGVRKSS
jgi:hypothetical protein